jgi:hypothetical protein
MLGGLLADTGHDEGYLPLEQMVNNVIAPLQATFGSQFGGVTGWQFAFDQAGAWANGIAQNTNNSTLEATFTARKVRAQHPDYLNPRAAIW